MNKVSVIIPAYNSEKTIKRCVNSVISQTYPELEIIIINDGSTDSTRDAIEEIEGKEKRLRCITQKNKGAAEARNTGLSMATGEYVAFIDSDDYISKELISELVKSLESTSADIVISTLLADAQYYPFTDNKSRTLKTAELDNYFSELYLSYSLNSVCGNLYKKDIAQNCTFFRKLRIGEDLTFNYQYIEKINKITFVPIQGYHYIANVMSATHTFSISDFEQQKEIRNYTQDFCKKVKVKNSQSAIDIMYVRNILDEIINTITYSPTQTAYKIIRKIRNEDLVDSLLKKHSVSELKMDTKRNLMVSLYKRKVYSLMIAIGKINYLRNRIKRMKLDPRLQSKCNT